MLGTGRSFVEGDSTWLRTVATGRNLDAKTVVSHRASETHPVTKEIGYTSARARLGETSTGPMAQCICRMEADE